MDIKSLLGEIASELDSEKDQSMTPQERTFHGVAQRLLLLERDLLAPGATRSQDIRVERLLEVIEKENF